MSTEPSPYCDPLQVGILQGTVLVIGKPGVGKSWLVLELAEQLAARGQKVGLLSTDMGQASVGVPTCLGLSLAAPWQEAVALWFIGDTTPVGNLLPTVVGTAQLVQYACRLQVRTLFIDTSGLVEGPLGRLLKYHKAVALGLVDHLIALQRNSELEPLLALLRERCRVIHRLFPAAEARDRNPSERKQYREARFRSHFQGGAILEVDPSRLLNLDWTVGPGRAVPAPGTVAGLLNAEGFCLGLGLVRQLKSDRLLLLTRWRDRDAVAWVQTGKIQLNSEGQEVSRLGTRG
jgi:polynucleotide 5'-kinase involved in rRNA processing